MSQHNSVTTQHCHNTTLSQHNSVTTQHCHNTTLSQHNSVTTQHCHNTTLSQHNTVTTQHCHNTTVSQLKISDFSGEIFKGFEVLHFSMSATTTQLLSSGEFYKLRYETIAVTSVSANVSFYTNNTKMPNFEL